MTAFASAYLPQFRTSTLNVPGGINNSQTTGIVLTTIPSDLDITKPGYLCLTYSNPINTDNAEWLYYTSIDGTNTLQGVVRGQEGYAAKAHLNGAAVAWVVSKSHINAIMDALMGVTTGVILNTPKLLTSLNDTNNNEIFKVVATTSAVNEITITNAATGNGVQISATGGDTDIDLGLVGKGAGKVKFGTANIKFPNTDGSNGQVLQTNGAGILSFATIGSTDGWTSSADTWTYASASSFTISGDKTATYEKGQKIKLTQTTVKYFYITAVSYGAPNTTITVAAGTDYSLANAAITSPFYSNADQPFGFPTVFNTSVGTFEIHGKTMIQKGDGTWTTNGVQGEYQTTITFATPNFSVAPKVFANLVSTTATPASNFLGVTCGSRATGSFIAYVRPNVAPGNPETVGFNWEAIGLI